MKQRKTIIRLMSILVCLLVAVLILSAPGMAEKAEKTNNCRLAPLNPGYLKYIDARKNMPQDVQGPGAKDGYPLGGVPSPVDLSHIRGALDETVNIQYPARYDLRQLGRVTDVKNQDGYPTCWIFAAFTSLESCLLPEAVDFAEWHMAISHGFDYTIEEGGNSYMTTAYLVRWSGPTDENNVPYGTILIPAPSYPLAKHVQQVMFLPEREGVLDNNTIKYFVTNYGPVDFSYFWEFESFNDATDAMYTPGNGGQNHRLAIVGWDDNYPASRFSFTPPGDGAFIARNSWGRSWGELGYCYISYYDESFQEFMSFNNAEVTSNYGTIYQYDPLGHTRTWGTRESWGANIFRAENSSPLTAVGFYVTDADVQYEVKVYTDVDTLAGNPTTGTLASVKSGGFTYAGYYTVKLDTPVPLERNKTFSTVVKFSNPQYPYSVPIESPIPHHSSRAAANPGESYVSLDGVNWNDLTAEVANSNVCIKAYAQYKTPNISLQAQRESIQCWIIRRDFGVITIHVDNLQEYLVSKLVLYRSSGGSAYLPLTEINGSELETANGDFIYIDKYLENSTRYNYKVATIDLDGLVSETSAPVSI
jgi:C1A family cysteine protease